MRGGLSGFDTPFSPEQLKVLARTVSGLYPREDLIRVVGPNVLTFDDLKIRTKESGTLVTFRPNPIQAGYLDEILPDWRNDPTGLRGWRDIILKGRQFGMSTLIMGLFFLDTVQTPYTTTVIIAHDGPTTEKMFETMTRFYNNLPEDRKPITRYKSRRELYFRDIESTIFVGQAGSTSFGAGLTINHALCSEVPRWPNAELLMPAINEAVPDSGNLVLESTARGVGNYFHKEWQKAYVERDSIYKPKFFFWGNFPDYRIDPDVYKQRKLEVPDVAQEYYREGPNKEEALLKDKLGLDDAQMAWRRWKMKSLGDTFPQEYPTTPDEAFMTSGKPFFNNVYLNALLIAMQGPESNAIPSEQIEYPEHFPLIKERAEELQVFKLPMRDRFFVMGVDTAEGLTGAGDRDYHSIHIFDTIDWEEYAHWHGRIGNTEFGQLCAQLGWWYNFALVGIERNNHGHAVIQSAKDIAFYPVMEEGQRNGIYTHEEYDTKTKTKSRRPGWPSNVKTNPIALSFLKKGIHEGLMTVHSRETISELMTFVHLKDEKVGGEKGCHDDRVSSLRIVAYLLSMHDGRFEAPLVGGASRADTAGYATATATATSSAQGSEYKVGGSDNLYAPPHGRLS